MKTILNTISFLLLGLTISYSANAQVTPTKATGGSAISADNVATTTYTTLTGPIMAEGQAGNIGGTGGGPWTIVLVPPAGFHFNTGGTAPTVKVTGSVTAANNINNVASGTSVAITSRTAKEIIFTVTAVSTVANTLTWQNISVIPAAGTPLASGNITDSTSSTSTITGITKGSTNLGTITEVAGALNKLVVSQSIATQIAGTAFSIGTTSITAEDQYSNILNTTNGNDFTGTVTLSTSATYGTLYPTSTITSSAFVNGVLSSQSITVTQATSQYIIATSGSVTGNSNTFSVNASAFTKMQIIVPGETATPGSSTGITGSPSAETAGTAFNITVNAVDNNWNVVSSAPANTIAITSTDTHANLPASNTLSSGTQTFSFNFETAGSWKITATNSSDGTKTLATSPSITVNAGALAQLIVSQSIANGKTAGTAFSMGTTSITAEDQYGNILNTTNGNDFTGMVTLSTNASSGTVSPTTSSAFVNGVLTSQSITVTQATSQAITATYGSISGTSNTFTVNAGTATMLAIQPISTPQTAGTAFSITVQAEDANGNAANVNQATVVKLTFSGTGTLSGNTGTIANGTSSITITTVSDTKAETVTFGAKETSGMSLSNAATSNSVVINAGTATKLVFTQQPSNVNQYAVMSPAVTIAAEDANGNINTNFTNNVTVSSTAIFVGTATTTVAAVSGVATFSNLTFSTVVTNKTIAATSTGLTGTGNSTTTFNVTTYATVATDYFESQASANWNVANTWKSSHDDVNWFTATVTPDYNSAGIVLISPDSVSVTANVEADNIVINSGAQLNINDGIILTINNGVDTDLYVYGTLKEIGTGSTGASITLNAGAIIAFESGGLYLHDFSSNSTQGNVPTATWDNGSTCEIIGFHGPSTTIHVGNLSQSFYNFTWNCPNQTVAYGLTATLTTIRNNFTMQSSGTTPQIVYGLGINTLNYTMTVGGNFIMNGGIFDFANSAASGTFFLNIGGSYDQTGGTFQSDYGGNGGLTVNFTGTGSFTQSGGTLTTTNMNFNINNGAALTMDNNLSVVNTFTVSSGGILYTSATTISGAGSFTLSSGGTLGIGLGAGINTSGSSNIQTNSKSFSTGGNYIYNGSGIQNTGTALPSTVASLTVNNASVSTLTVTNSGTLTITNTLTLTKGIVVSASTVLYVTDTAEASVTGYSSSSYIEDSLRRAIHNNGTYDFPVGNSTNYELARLKLHSSSGITYLTAHYNTGLPATLPVFPTSNINGSTVTSMLNSGYWTVTPNTSTYTVNYDITLYESGYSPSGIAASEMGIIKRHNSSDPWHGTNKSMGYDGLQGFHNDSTQTIVNGFARAKRTSVEGFSDYGIGYGGTTLPITLTSFGANAVNNSQVNVNWHTAAELNSNYFVVERSNDAVSFDSIGTVEANGTTVIAHNYSFVDYAPLIGTSYYRLDEVDLDGTRHYSDISVVTITISNIVSVYPNPTTDEINIKLNNNVLNKITVIGIDGKLYLQQIYLGENGLANLDVSSLPAGIYMLSVDNGSSLNTTKFIKQ